MSPLVVRFGPDGRAAHQPGPGVFISGGEGCGVGVAAAVLGRGGGGGGRGGGGRARDVRRAGHGGGGGSAPHRAVLLPLEHLLALWTNVVEVYYRSSVALVYGWVLISYPPMDSLTKK